MSTAFDIASLASGTAIGVAGLGTGYYYFWQGKRRNQLKIKVDFQSLLGGNAQLGQKLTILCNDEPIAEPYFVTVFLTNDGPKDIRSDDFENGKSLRIHLPGMIVALLPLDNLDVDTKGGEIHVSPCLLPKDKPLTIAVILNAGQGGEKNESSTVIMNQPANTDIVTDAQVL